MEKYKFNIELLNEYIIKACAKIIKHDNKLYQMTSIEFECSCGEKYTKKFCYIVYNGGAYCKKCTRLNKLKKIQNTCFEKYGVINPSQLKEIKEKKNETYILNYGCHPLQHPQIQEKRNELHLEKYGVINPSQREDVIEKIKITFEDKYGGHPMKLEEIKEKVKNTCFEKYGGYPAESEDVKKKMKETCIIKYGGSPMQNKDIQQKSINTNLEKYGVAYPAQNTEIFEKTQHSLKKYKKYKMPSGEIKNIQGYEHYAINLLLQTYTEEQIKTERKDIPRILYKFNDKDKYYFPDIYIPHENKIIEVKSKWIYNLQYDINNTKAEYTKMAGYNFEFWIFDKNGNLIN